MLNLHGWYNRSRRGRRLRGFGDVQLKRFEIALLANDGGR